MSRHEPLRPQWRCAGCAEDWPCPTRQAELVREHGAVRTMLGLTMARELSAAMADRPDLAVSALYGRFLGWVRNVTPGQV